MSTEFIPKVKSPSILAGVVLLIGLLLTSVAMYVLNVHVHQHAQEQVDRWAGRIESELRQRFRLLEAGLRSVASFHSSSEKVTHQEFRRFVTTRDFSAEIPGVRGIGMIWRVPREQLSNFIERQRVEGLPNFYVDEAGEDSELFVFRHMEPLARHPAIPGWNIARDPEQRLAAERAMRSGRATLGPPLRWPGASEEGKALLFMLPVYRQGQDPLEVRARQSQLEAWVCAPVMLTPLLASLAGEAEPMLEFAFFDGQAINLEKLLYASSSVDPGFFARARSKKMLHLGERSLTLVFWPSPAGQPRRAGVWWLGLAGLAVSLLLGEVVYLLARARGLALNMARDMRADHEAAQTMADEVARANRCLLQTIQQYAIVSIADRDGRITEVNDAFCVVSGYRREALIGQDHRIISSGTHDSAFWASMWATITAGQPWRGLICNRHRDGGLFWLDCLIAPILDRQGDVERYVSIRFDVTESRHDKLALASERQRLSHILEGTHAGTWEWHVPSGQVRINARWAEIIGYTQEELGVVDIETWSSLAHPDDLAHSGELLRRHFAGELDYYECEARMRHKDGHWVWVLDRGRVISREEDGRPAWMAGTHIDISAIKQIEEELRRERNLFVGGPVVVFSWLMSEGWPVDYVSGNVESVFGYPVEQVMGSKFAWMLHPDDLPGVEAEVRRHALERAVSWEQHYRVQHADGHYRYVYDFSVAVRDEDGALHSVRGYLLDMSAQKEVELALRQTSSLLGCVLDAATGIAIIATDLDGVITVFNRGAEAMFGYAASEVVGLQTPQIIHDAAEMARRATELSFALGRIPQGIELFVESARSREGEADEWTFLRHDGSRFIGSLHVTSMLRDDGVIQGYLGVIQDVTRVHEHEAQLHQARGRAEAANVAKSVFLANMSHEIRTPMNGVIGMTSLLLDTELSDEQRQAACIIQSSAESLLGLINDILDFSKIEAGKLEFESRDFFVRKVLDDCLAAFACKAGEKGLRLHGEVNADVPACLRGDPGRLRQVLTNLLGNAIKFTASGEVCVRAVLQWQDASRVCVRFCVKDTGIGIPKSRQSELFQSFAQLDASTTRQYGGSGLGLAISRQLVEMMGGEISVDSEEGLGAEFCFTALLARCECEPEPVCLPVSPVMPHTARILVAEDNPVNCKIVLAMLAKLRVEAVAVENGFEALAVLSQDDFDLVLMDVQMPEMDGLEATRRIRDPASAVRRHDIPVIALTANAMVEDRLQCSKVGMNDHLAKPLTLPALTQALLRWLPDQAAGISAM